jgi:cyclophilin family peptidyl-prolyl cis-trans isomerase
MLEVLEDRRLLTASLQPISNLTVPAQQGYTLPLNGSATTDAQTFTVTSSNPDIAASVPPGPFWTINVQYTDARNPANNFSGPLTFQLFQNLTPNTVSHIQEFSNDGYYTGKHFTRVATGFPGATDYVVQGGAPNPNGTGNSGQPGTPFANENVQQLAFTGTDQLAMANAGGTNSNDTQFFITTGSPNSELGYNYTIFGQMVSGQATLARMTQIPVQPNPALGGENSLPVNPLIMSSVSLSNSNSNGVVLLDTTQAKQGETSTITVTATDPTDGSHVSQSFTVTVGTYAGPTSPAINFRPFANPVTATAASTVPTTITLSGQSGYPSSSTPGTLSFALVSQPSHGTISNFNATTGTLTYTPSASFQGSDTFQYQVTASGPQATPATTTSNPATVTITVTPAPPVNTGAVRVVGPVLIVTPPPRRGHATNTIDVVQVPGPSSSSSPVIEVIVNGQIDMNQPSTSSLDHIVVFGAKAGDTITVDPSVTLPATLDGGHGGRNVLKGGSGETREHGWFGFNTLIGGPGPNQLIGRAGHVRFKPSSTTTIAFAGIPHRRTAMLNPTPPGGTFYVFKNGHLIPITELSHSARTSSGHTAAIRRKSGPPRRGSS